MQAEIEKGHPLEKAARAALRQTDHNKHDAIIFFQATLLLVKSWSRGQGRRLHRWFNCRYGIPANEPRFMVPRMW